jgi:enoyl-CoA hydratase/carnithine racemase
MRALAFARREWHSAEKVTAKETKMAGVKQGRDGAVGILTLNEPESLNAMTPDLLGALEKAIAEMTADPTVRALVLTGEGRGFCSGQNLKAAEALGQDIVNGVMKFYWPAFKALRECRVPTVVAVNGVAAGGGKAAPRLSRSGRRASAESRSGVSRLLRG